MADSRASNGQFLPGNPGGPGRPPKESPSRYLTAMEAIITDSDWKRLVYATYDRALKGDHRAREWLAKYLIGQEKPKVVVDMAADNEVVYTSKNGRGESTTDFKQSNS